jgi:hypothetical protein
MSNLEYNAPYLDEDEHSVLNHTGIPGVGAGTGGGSSSLIQISSILSTVPESVDTIIQLDPTVAGGFFYRLQESDLAWGGLGNESKINVLTDGFYTLKAFIVGTPGSEAYGLALTPYIDGNVVYYYEFGSVHVPLGGAAGVSARVGFTKVPISAGSFVEVHVTQVGNTTNDNGVAAVTVLLTKDA